MLNTKLPFAAMDKLSAALFRKHHGRGQAGDRAANAVRRRCKQATATLLMLAVITVPVPLVTVQLSPAGCVNTVTA